MQRKLSLEAEPASVGEKLRVLDGFEEYLWLTENTFTRSAMVLAEIEGQTTVGSWKAGIAQIQQRYPLLNARVTKIAGQRPFFAKHDMPVPIKILPFNDSDLGALMEAEPIQTFGYGDSALGRFIICYGTDRSAVIFSSHHVAFDGRTNVQVVLDVIAAVARQPLPNPYPLHPVIGEYLGLGQPMPYRQLAAVKLPPSTYRAGLPAPRLARTTVDAGRTEALRQLARREGTTLQGALVAALYLEGKSRAENWQRGSITCFSPIDLRPILGLQNEAGVFVGVHPTILDPKSIDNLWTIARSVTLPLAQSRTVEGAKIGAELCRTVVENELDPDDTRNIDPNGIYRHDLMVSNYGPLETNTSIGGLQIRSMYPCLISGTADTQSLSAQTVDGVLHITHMSRKPIDNLLNGALARLSARLDR